MGGEFEVTVYTGSNGGWRRDGSVTRFAPYVDVAQRVSMIPILFRL